VTDNSGAAVPDASISVTNQSTGETKTTSSSADGSYVVAALRNGTYKVTVGKQGFETYAERDVVVHPSLVATINVILKVGMVTTTVEVKASPVSVQIATPEISGEISATQAASLPVYGRNFESLVTLTPGVANLTPGTDLGGGGDQTTQPLSINGMGQSATHFTLDGVWNADTGSLVNITITPPPDSIQEVRVLQNNYSVKYNLYGANVVNVQTKSGISQFHGLAYDFLRNDALDARNFFSPTVSPLKQNIFGYNIGGPIYIPNHYNSNKDKTFFFWSQQWRYQNIASVVRGATPTAEMRQGNFNVPITDPQTGQPFPEISPGVYQIPSDRILPDSVALINALMSPPNNPAGGFENYINLNPQINRQRDDQIKVEHNFSSKLRLMAEYFREDQKLNFPNQSWLGSPFTTNSFTDITLDQLAQLELTAVLTPSMVNSLRVSTSQYVDDFPMHGIWQQSQIPGFRQSLPFHGYMSDRLPEIDLSGGYPAIGVSTSLPIFHAGTLTDGIADDWSLLRGNHFIEAGATVVLTTKRQAAGAPSNGVWDFSGQFTGDPIADLLLGLPDSLSQASTDVRMYVTGPLVSPYIQDRWKATRRLTLTIGARLLYEPAPNMPPGFGMFLASKYDPAKAPIVNSDSSITPTPNYDPLNGFILNGVNGIPRNYGPKHAWFWAPSVGFAYDVFGDGKTSLRGGYGLTYTSYFGNTYCLYGCATNPPVVSTFSYPNPPFPDATGATAGIPLAPSVATEDLDTVQPVQVQSYSLSAERQFGTNWFLSIAGAGNQARHMRAPYNINQPLPDPPYDFNPIINTGSVFTYLYGQYLGYGSISGPFGVGTANWHALEVNARHPVGRNLFLSASYTWSHGLSNLRGLRPFGGSSVQDIYHPGNDYGNSNIDLRQTFSLSTIWTLPWYRNAHGLKGLALSGWKFSDITSIQSGFSLDPGLSTSHKGLATRPNLIGSVQGPKTVGQWFNTNAFARPAAGFFGNAGRGVITGPGLINFDMAFYKDFPISERFGKIEFRAELFNIFNHANFNAISTSFGSGSFGQVVGAADPRVIEFALRYEF
jgi:hypothetical protein